MCGDGVGREPIQARLDSAVFTLIAKSFLLKQRVVPLSYVEDNGLMDEGSLVDVQSAEIVEAAANS